MSLKWKTPKDPDELLDYVFDWSERLEADTILSVTTSVVSGNVTIEETLHDDTTVTVWLSGGEDGELCPILCEVVTAGGRRRQQTIGLRVKAK